MKFDLGRDWPRARLAGFFVHRGRDELRGSPTITSRWNDESLKLTTLKSCLTESGPSPIETLHAPFTVRRGVNNHKVFGPSYTQRITAHEDPRYMASLQLPQHIEPFPTDKARGHPASLNP